MIFGLDRRRRSGIAGLAVLLAAAAAPAVPALGDSAGQADRMWETGQLMSSLKQVKSASGQFVERKTLHALSTPLVSSGTLLYVAPDQLQKVTLEPRRERLAVDGDRLTIEGGADGRTRTLSLSDYPEVGAFVEAIRATLAGDLPALRRFYAVRLEGGPADWQLLLEPKAQELKDFVKWIRISGNGNQIRLVETDSGDGDHSEMSVAEKIH